MSKRLKIGLLHSDVAVKLWIDPPLQCKIENGLRRLKREQIPINASILNTDKEELLTIWLADQIYDVVKDEKTASKAIQIIEQKINTDKSRQKK